MFGRSFLEANIYQKQGYRLNIDKFLEEASWKLRLTEMKIMTQHWHVFGSFLEAKIDQHEDNRLNIDVFWDFWQQTAPVYNLQITTQVVYWEFLFSLHILSV